MDGIGSMKFCFIGEAMIEISGNADSCKMGFAGDTLNTSVHLARFGHEVSYFTAIGNDDFSNDFIEFLAREKVGSDLIIRHPNRHMGLYTIKLDEKGERSFQYWRDSSAAKEVLAGLSIEDLLKRLSGFDYVCFSLVSVAILSPADRDKLFAVSDKLRTNGVKIVFDGNYRPKLWQRR
jgi:2-dehydro-3-deoxygluconokinase